MTDPQSAEAVRSGDRAHGQGGTLTADQIRQVMDKLWNGSRPRGPARDELDAARASRCYAADTCTMDLCCPFAADCRKAEMQGESDGTQP